MTDLHRKNRLKKRFNRLQERAEQAEERGDHEQALELYQQLLRLLGEAASLLGTGSRERFMKQHVVNRIEQLGGEVPEDVGLDGEEQPAAKEPDDEVTARSIEGIEDVDSDLLEPMRPKHGFDAVGGQDRVKRILREKVIETLENREQYRQYGVSVINGLLLFGPSGTGKTYLVKALAKELQELGYTSVKTSGSNLKNRYLGESEGNVKELFDILVELQPCMVFIDEADALLSAREDASVDGMADMVNEFLKRMIAVKDEDVFVVGATNHPQRLDPAVLSASRFEEQLKIGMPSKQTRRDMMQKMLEKKPEDPSVVGSNIDLRAIAEDTHGYSAADLDKLVEEALRPAARAGTTLQQNHLRHGLQETSPSSSSG